MKAVVIEEPGKVIVQQVDMPEPAPDELIVSLKYVGFCGSDLNTYLGRNPLVEYPRIPGHEISGIIENCGKNVPAGFSAGEAVTVVPYTSCGHCSSCRGGRSNACRSNQTLGVQRDGAMQQYMAVPWQKILKAPELNALELAMVEPLTVGFHAIERGRVNQSDQVMVLGCGMIGTGAILNAVLKGAKVIAVDIDDHKLSMARDLGAWHTLNFRQADFHSALREMTGGDGPDVVVEAAGNPDAYRAALNELAFTGRLVCIGYVAGEIPLPTRLIVQKEIDIMGSRNASPDDFRSVISYLAKKTFPLEKIITRKVRPEDAAAALKDWARDPGKVMKILLDLT